MSKVQFEVQELKSKNKFLNIEITKLKKEILNKEKQLRSGSTIIGRRKKIM